MSRLIILNLLLVGLLLLSGCQSEKTTSNGVGEQAKAEAQDETDFGITVEGRFVPKASVTLAFAIAGQVGEVFVQDGDMVQPGQVIARLADRQSAQASVKAAEFEQLLAQQALDALMENQEEVQNQALLALKVARQAVEEAQRYLDSITGYPLQNDIAGARAQVILAEDALNAAKEKYDNYLDREETDKVRSKARVELSEAQRAYNQAVKQLDDLQGEGYQFILAQAETTLEVAKEEVVLAEDANEKASKGVDPDAVAAAQARLALADATLVSAQAVLSQAELRAPMAGTLVGSSLKVGQQVTPNLPVVEIVDFSAWFIETTDLTEIDIVHVQVGQGVEVIADALPELKMMGKVVVIRDSYQEVRGEITYVSRIEVEETDPRLRWGMTVMVKFMEP